MRLGLSVVSAAVFFSCTVHAGPDISVKKTLDVSLSFTYSMPGGSDCSATDPDTVGAEIFITPPNGVETSIGSIRKRDVLPSSNCDARVTRQISVPFASGAGMYKLRLAGQHCYLTFFNVNYFPSVALSADGTSIFKQDYLQDHYTTCDDDKVHVDDTWQIRVSPPPAVN